jgi:L-ascorbate metabolism protein UlaG (beta-lactamase superfamily)
LTGPRLTHIGGPTVLIEVAGWRLLTDPTFDPPGRRYRFGWGTSSRKLAGPAIAASELGRIDAVLLSHDQHADNLDEAGRELLPAAGAVVTTRPGAARLGSGARGLDAWESTRLEAPGRPALEITATPSRHGPPLLVTVSGPTVGFSLSVEGEAGGAFWITGDTVLYPPVRAVAERIDVDAMLIHVGCVRFPVTGPLRYTMTAREAIELCGLVRPRLAIPVHYEGWSHLHEGRDEFERELASAPAAVRDSIHWLPLGAGVDLPPDERAMSAQP